MDMDLMEEERNWEAEADRIANAPFDELEEVISIAQNDAAAVKKSETKVTAPGP